jgi:hypothetical protein
MDRANIERISKALANETRLPIFEAARRAISQRFGNSVPAPRYGIGARASV